MEKFTVYILKSQLRGKHYIGYTVDIKKRLKEHNEGLNRSTKYGVPWGIVYTEDGFRTRSDAIKREREIKSWKGGIKFKLLFNQRV